MKIQRIKNLQGTEKFGTCLECGRDSYLDTELVRISVGHIHKASFCLCPKCLNRLISELRDNF
jgi:hypothetical protein